MMKKKAIVLGAGRSQIPMMELCHKHGWSVIAITPEGDYPGIGVADKVYYFDVRNTVSVVDVIRRENAGAVLSDQLDEAVFTAASAAEQTGLKGIGSDVARRFTNKYEMRKAAAALGISVPYSICAASLPEAEKLLALDRRLRFPVMLKPVDSSASRGIFLIRNLNELREKFEQSRRYSNSGRIIIEQYIRGKEYAVDAYTHEYQVENLIIGHRDYFDIPDTFIPGATVFVDAESGNSHVEEKIKAVNRRLVEGFGLPFGITHGEYLYVPESDSVYLVEIAARGGGVFISSDLIPAACGVNANDLLVRDVLGLEADWSIALSHGASAYFCYLTPEGIIREINHVEQVKKLPGVRKAFFDNVAIGMETKAIADKYSRKGPILVQGGTKEECYQILSKVKQLLSISVETKNGYEGVIWSYSQRHKCRDYNLI